MARNLPTSRMALSLRPGVSIADAHPLGVVMGGWKPRSPGVAPWRDFPQHALVLTVSGTARYVDERGIDIVLRPGDLLAIFPGLKHGFLPEREGGWDEYFLIFSGPTFAPWVAETLLSPERPVMALGEVGYWLRRFTAVLGDDANRRAVEVVARMHGLLAEIVGAAASRLDRGNATWLTRAQQMLADDARPSLTTIAHRLGCSDQVFRKRFRALAGTPPNAYRERLRLEEASRLLAAHAAGEVADRLGFCDQFQFSRRFKARFGISPRQFQRL